MLILFGDKIRSQTKPFLYLFQLVGAKDPVHERKQTTVMGPCCTIPKQDSSLSGADFAQLTCCRTGIPNPVILLIAFTHASASPTCAL